MCGFEKLCLETKGKLGRALKENEVEFLRWLYDRHIEEIANKNKVKKHDELK